MANPSYQYTLTNATTADASQVMQNFNDILNGVTDGTKDISISALTVAGTATLNGHVTLGNASGDDITVTGSLASSIGIKTTATYNVGDSTKGLAGIYFGANSQTVRIVPSGSLAATYTLTLPTTAGTNNYVLATNGSGVLSWVDGSNLNFPAATATTAGTVTKQAVGSVSAQFAFNGSGGNTTVTLRYQRIGDWVTLFIPAILATAGTGSNTLTANAAVDNWAKPASASQVFSIPDMANNGATLASPGYAIMPTSGLLTIFRDGSGTAWTTGAANCGVGGACTVSYYVGTGS